MARKRKKKKEKIYIKVLFSLPPVQAFVLYYVFGVITN